MGRWAYLCVATTTNFAVLPAPVVTRTFMDEGSTSPWGLALQAHPSLFFLLGSLYGPFGVPVS